MCNSVRLVLLICCLLLVATQVKGQGKMGVEYKPAWEERTPTMNCPSTQPETEIASREWVKSLLPRLNTLNTSFLITHDISSPGGRHLSIVQVYLGVPVYSSESKVNLNKQGEVVSVFDNTYDTKGWKTNSLKKDIDALSSISISDKFQEKYQLTGKEIETKVAVLAKTNEAQAGAIVELRDPVTASYVRYLVDKDLSILGEKDLNSYHKADPGNGLVFNPDPLTTSGRTYGGNYVDDSDGPVTELNDERFAVELDVDQSGGFYILRNDYVIMVDNSAPSIAPPALTDSIFHFGREEDGFEDVNVFYHITEYQKYLQSLGFTNLVNYQLTVDAHALNGQDQSLFSPGAMPRLLFGEGGVDDAEDADVVIHEYAHAISYSAAPNTNDGLERTSLDECFGDYLCVSFSRDLNEFDWQNTFSWDGHNEFWPGRTAVSSNTYPDDLSSSIHGNGEIYVAALMEIWEQLGRTVTDRLMIQSVYSYSSQMTMDQAALLLVQADTLLYNGANYCTIYPILKRRGLVSGDVSSACSKLDVSITAIAGDDQLICTGDEIVLGDVQNIQTDYSYLWEPSDGLDDPTSATPVLTAQGAGTYTLTVTSPNLSFNTATVSLDLGICKTRITNSEAWAFGEGDLQVFISNADPSATHQFEIIDIMGQRVIDSRELSVNNFTLPSASFGLGVYIIRIRTGKETFTQKVSRLK